jgi:hypothetical protein
VQTQIPFGNDNKKGKSNSKYNSRSLRDDNEKSKGKCECRFPAGNGKRKGLLREWRDKRDGYVKVQG